MRCFLPCFSPSKRKKHFSSEPDISISSHPIQQNPFLEESILWISSESKEKDTKENHQVEECSYSLFSVSIGRGKSASTQDNASETETEIEVNSTPMQLHPMVLVKKPEPKKNSNEAKDEEEEEEEEDRRMNQPMLEYRYQDCYDDGYDDISLDDGVDDSHNKKIEKRSSEDSSLFSLSTNFCNKKRYSFSSSEKVDNEVTSKMVALQEDDDDEVLSVLNPIENGSQRKMKMLNTIKKDKENINWIEEKTSLKVCSSSKEKEKEEIGVDSSLSDWLVESENKDDNRKRGDVEDRAILRALTVEEIRKCSSVSKTCSKSNKCVKDGKQDWSSTTIKNRV